MEQNDVKAARQAITSSLVLMLYVLGQSNLVIGHFYLTKLNYLFIANFNEL